jgi:hypothetical protein
VARLTACDASRILSLCNITPKVDFSTLSTNQVDDLVAESIRYGYRKPKNANGSRGRYFHAYLTRLIERRDRE